MLKNLALFGLLLAATTLAAPAQQTLLDGDVAITGFGGPSVAFTTLDGAGQLMAGGTGGALFGHTFAVGGFGYGLTTEMYGSGPTPETRRRVGLGYGGVMLGYINSSDNVIHLTARLGIGGGGVSYHGEVESTVSKTGTSGTNIVLNIDPEFDAFFVLEPAVGLELNVTKFMRIEGSVDYRMIRGVDLEGLSDAKLSGPAGALTFKFGAF